MRRLSLIGLLSGLLLAPSALAGGPPTETERGFPIHTIESAPSETTEVLNWYVTNFKFVPNLSAVMAESPALLTSYWQLQTNLQKSTKLSPPEDNIVQMSIAMENECQYCVAGHTMAGRIFFKSPEAQLEAIRKKASLPTAKFNALRNFAIQVFKSHGRVTDAQLKAFYQVGYDRSQALEVVANVAAKVMSNFANQVARTPLDDQIKPFAKGLPFAEERAVLTRRR
ncbi:MAG: putative peroxidase-related enzyme [Myxococcota bacterium]|jgi:uncharacterized peroxidase-related enzyme